jgi:hypothetical protein
VERSDQLAAARIVMRARLESLERGEPEASSPVEDAQRADRQPAHGALAVIDDRDRARAWISS